MGSRRRQAAPQQWWRWRWLGQGSLCGVLDNSSSVVHEVPLLNWRRGVCRVKVHVVLVYEPVGSSGGTVKLDDDGPRRLQMPQQQLLKLSAKSAMMSGGGGVMRSRRGIIRSHLGGRHVPVTNQTDARKLHVPCEAAENRNSGALL